MYNGCGGLVAPFPWHCVTRVVRVYIQVTLIVLTLVLGTTLGLDPIIMLGWGTVAWLFAGRLDDAASRAAAGRQAR